MKAVAAVTACLWFAVPAPSVMADEAWAPIPSCALSGASSVMIGGQPALRLSDVANCPPELYEVVPSIMIEGQPVVHFRAGSGAKGDCVAKAEATVTFEGEAAQRVGDVDCRQK
ncbi:PAAR domain-containing protein [Ensifer adhaerens]|uniref:PAAR domain-containing protein n=1 Tax=Ensifer adhaerens TaxID=106592 RepID=UPI0023A95F3D|nr:PAAR domain-containing protein [Ensifer adhaerens]WDZ75376.1 PAAR domain-containing protein [Ensifer adhaerens]